MDALFGETLLSKEGNVATKDALAGAKNIMVYFTKNMWCGLTPQLARAYKESPVAGKDTVVIFVSSDKDQASFDFYYGEMPWLALPFEQRDLKGTLSEKFEVKDIPMLIVLDDKGELVTANGRAEFQKYLSAPEAAPAGGAQAPSGGGLADLFGDSLMSKEGKVATKDTLAGKKNIMVYFSAHWCPPCRGFTPQLAQAYKDSPSAGKDTGVIFVSSDRDQAGFDGYFGEMPWLALPFEERDIKTKLSEKFGVQGIPMLIVLDDKGELVTANGRAEYQKYLSGGGAGPAAKIVQDEERLSNNGAEPVPKPKGAAACCIIS